MGNSVPGGWFIGRAASREEEEEPQAAATEPKPAITQIPAWLSSLFALLWNIVTWPFHKQDYFVGTPENLGLQAATAAADPAQPASELQGSRSFLGLYSCKSSGSTIQESRVLPTSYTGVVNAYNMENKRNRSRGNPKKLSFELIKLITNDFSQELGHGTFGQVFKGVLEDGEEVAVKMLRSMPHINDKQFENEFEILKRLNRTNIVRLVAFCHEDQEVCMEYNGKLIVCYRVHRALCLEYMPNGSLGKLLKGENLGKNWPIRYKIIKGICEGLKYLREGLECPIFHFDLKLDNILLNKEMVPKISDFGLSRLIAEENTKRTLTPLGTRGYLPPEFINHQVISKEYDIYSLGVVVTKIITGIAGYSDVADMGAEEFVEHVHEKWKQCLKEIPKYAPLEVECKQVKRCIEIARRCMENDRRKRPTIKDIVSQLDEIEMENWKLDSPQDIVSQLHEIEVENWKLDLPQDIVSQLDETEMESWKLDSTLQSKGGLPGIIILQGYECCFPERYGEASYTSSASCPMVVRHDMSELPRIASWFREWTEREARCASVTELAEPLSLEELGSSQKDPVSEITHPAHPEHKLKLMTTSGAPFLCDGCKEPGYGSRYVCDCGGRGQSIELHMRCALAEDHQFHLHTLLLALFGYGKQFVFRFLHEPPTPAEGRSRRVCDSCGEATRGFVYHCSEQDIDLHPCCASLPDRIIQDGRAFDLHWRASRPCAMCPENEDQRRRWFWAYRCNLDGDEAAVDLHVACLKETARRGWEDVGDGALNVDSVLENKFGEVAGTVASFITALVSGNLIVKM